MPNMGEAVVGMVKVRLKLPGLNRLMRSAEVQSVVNAEAARIAHRAGSKYRMVPSSHRFTARAFVEPEPGESVDDADTLGLLRSISRQ